MYTKERNKMENIVTRVPTSEMLELTSFSRSFSNISFSGKKSTPKTKVEISKDSQKLAKSRFSIRDKRLLQIFASHPDQPLNESITAARGDSSSNDSFVCSGRSATADDKRLITAPMNDENTSPNKPTSGKCQHAQLSIAFFCKIIRNFYSFCLLRDFAVSTSLMGLKEQPPNNYPHDNTEERPTTPVDSIIPSDLATTPVNSHPFMARIKRDLNSPSAALRVRAMKALKYIYFYKLCLDIYHKLLIKESDKIVLFSFRYSKR